MSITAAVAAPLAPITQSPPTTVQQVRLAATTVPPGGLITSFLHNQTVYCSLICPLLVQTGVTAVSTMLQVPGTLFAALQSHNLLQAIGVAAESVTGPTDTAIEKAIAVDAAIPAQRALNAFEVGVVGLLNIIPAVTGGPSAILAAIGQARLDTFNALNAPFVPNPTPTVMPHGVVEVAVVQAINVVAAVIFPAFNDVLAGAFQVPNAVAKELAATGNPVQALLAGIRTAAGVVTAAGTVIANAIGTAINTVRNAAAASVPVTVAGVTPKVAAAAPVPGPKVSALSATAGTSPKTLGLLSSGGKSTDHGTPAGALRTSTTNVSPKGGQFDAPVQTGTHVTGTTSSGAHPNDRGSHVGKPSRPAFRANR
ncbi:hypothetical protein ABIA30_004169 [Mycobacterium sp. MAA66]|uniref:hypothetical protein n=1 Tax=Mycobacterium sp. MAA66 TaxID=3156297 RepID=UPI003514BD6F